MPTRSPDPSGWVSMIQTLQKARAGSCGARGTETVPKITVRPSHRFTDPSRSAWQVDRKRPGWDALLDAIRAGLVKHLFIYHPDRLMRQPWDLEILLRLVDEHGLMLYGQAGKRDLSNPDDRFILRIEVAHACRSSDDTSRRVKDALKEKRAAGRPHGGKRIYGYEVGMGKTIPAEAKVVREQFRRFLQGRRLRAPTRRVRPSAGRRERPPPHLPAQLPSSGSPRRGPGADQVGCSTYPGHGEGGSRAPTSPPRTQPGTALLPPGAVNRCPMRGRTPSDSVPSQRAHQRRGDGWHARTRGPALD